jgi:tetratricopeptide (TPR) repeat protein
MTESKMGGCFCMRRSFSLTLFCALFFAGTALAQEKAGEQARLDRQIARLEERLKRDAPDANDYATYALALLQKVRAAPDPAFYALAERALREALNRDSANLQASVGMGSLCLARHDFFGALDWGKKVLVLSPSNSAGLGIIADSQMELGLYDEAVTTVQQMVDGRPGVPSNARTAQLRFLYGDIPGAIEIQKEAIAVAATRGGEAAAWSHSNLGLMLLKANRLDEARLEFEQALRDIPFYERALAGLGQVRAAEGAYGAAIESYSEAIRRFPLPQHIMDLADVYRAAGKPGDAARQDALLEAITKVERANGINIDVDLALYYANHDRDPEKTVALARQALKTRPNIYSEDVLAWALFKKGDIGEAGEHMQKALSLGTQEPRFFFHAGMIYAKQGRTNKALNYLKKALDLNPHFSVLDSDKANQIRTKLETESK